MAIVLTLSACGGGFRPAPVHDRSVGSQSSAVLRDSRPGKHIVRKGDTLYSIAFRYKLNYQDLARWNGIGAPYTIYPGQELGITPQTSAYAANTGRSSTSSSGSRQPTTAGTVSRPDVGSTRPISSSGNNRPVESRPRPAATTPTVTAPAPTPAPPTSTVQPPASTRTAAATPAGMRNSRGVNWMWPVAGGRVSRGYIASENNRQGLDIAGTPGQPVLAAADGEVVYSGPGLTGYAELIIIKHNDELLSAYGHNRLRVVQEGQSVKAGQKIAELGRSPRGEDEVHFQIRRLGKPQDPQDYLPRR